jgi:hypothetical protein
MDDRKDTPARRRRAGSGGKRSNNAQAAQDPKLFPWGRLKALVTPSVESRYHIVKVDLPYPRPQLTTDVDVQPLSLRFREQDVKVWKDWIAADPTRAGSLLLDALATDRPTPSRGRHARRPISGSTLRLAATGIYLTLERWGKQNQHLVFEALKKHARKSGYRDEDLRQVERGGRWHLSWLTAYVIQQTFPQAFEQGDYPTEDPKAFYGNYIRGRRGQLQKLRALLAKSSFPRAEAMIFSLIDPYLRENP